MQIVANSLDESVDWAQDYRHQAGGNLIANLLGQMTSPIWRVEDLVVENRKVEGQPQPDRMGWLHLGARYFKRFLVRPLRVVHYAFCLGGRQWHRKEHLGEGFLSAQWKRIQTSGPGWNGKREITKRITGVGKREKKRKRKRKLVRFETDLFSELAGFLRWIEDLVIEDREVESQTQPNWVRRLHFGLADFKSILIRLLRVVDNGWKNGTGPRTTINGERSFFFWTNEIAY